jgi:hypothetical protein
MKKVFLFLSLFLLAESAQAAIEVTGTVENLFINSASIVRLKVVDEFGNYPAECKQGLWPFKFTLNQPNTIEWMDMLKTARITQEILTIGYYPNEDGYCDIQYVYFRG